MQRRERIKPKFLDKVSLGIASILIFIISAASDFAIMFGIVHVARFIAAVLSPFVPSFLRQLAVSALATAVNVLPAMVITGLSFVANIAPVIFLAGMVKSFMTYSIFSKKEHDIATSTAAIVATALINPAATTVGLIASASVGSALATEGAKYFNGVTDRASRLQVQNMIYFVAEYTNDQPLIKVAINQTLSQPHFNLANDQKVYLFLSQDASGNYQATIIPKTEETLKKYDPKYRIRTEEEAEMRDPENNNEILAWDECTIKALKEKWGDLTPQENMLFANNLNVEQGRGQGFIVTTPTEATIETLADAAAVDSQRRAERRAGVAPNEIETIHDAAAVDSRRRAARAGGPAAAPGG